MLSLGLAVLLFLFLTALGQAVLSGLKVRLGLLRSWLLAPAVGLAVLVLCLMLGSQGGMPIRSFAWPLALVLAGAAAAGCWVRRPPIPWRPMRWFLGAGLLFILWTAWPAFKFGFNWISYVNQDFTNYCLSAQRYMNYGFYRTPRLDELGGKDYSQWFWFMEVASLARFGADQVLAWVASLCRSNPLRIFMPVILALSLAQIFAAAGLVLQTGRWRRQAQWTAVLLAFSPLFMLGALYQLIAQAGGLTLMMALLALLTVPAVPANRRRLIVRAVPTALVGAALAVYYPEVAPFAILAFGLFAAARWARTRSFPALHLVHCEYALVGVIVLIRHNLFSCVYFLLHQVSTTVGVHDPSMAVFPFFLIPSGLSDLFGLQPQNLDLPDPYGSAVIVIGMLLLAACVVAAVRKLRHPLPLACLFVVQLALGLKLFHDGEDFGLYKLAMFIQPALMAALAFALLEAPQARWSAPAAASLLFALTVPAALAYTRASTGGGAGGFVELRNASKLMAEGAPAAGANAHWTSPIDNVVAVELAAELYRGTDVRFLSSDFFATRTLFESDWAPLVLYPHRDAFSYGGKLLRERARLYTRRDRLFDSDYVLMREVAAPTAYLQLPTPLGLFNKFHAQRPEADGLFSEQPPAAISNVLTFVHSSRGLHYYNYHYTLAERRNIAFFQQETDFFDPVGACNGIGRFVLLRVQNPTDPFYFEFSLTNTVMRTGRTVLPPEALVLGRQNIPLRLVGNGAAHRIVGPIKPVWRDGVAFIAIDFQRPAMPLPYRRSGLKSLYHGQVPLDYRWLVAYARDFSAVSAAERDGLVRPRRVGNFPHDLVEAAGLEFSGIYEDGWLSPASEIVLGPARPGESLRLKGYVPELPGQPLRGELLISVNGGATLHLGARVGYFDWTVPIPAPNKATRVNLRWTSTGLLPHGDDRPVGAKLDLLEIGPPALAADYSRAGSARPASEGVDQDGWVGEEGRISLGALPAGGRLELEVEFPGNPGFPAENPLIASIDGDPVVRQVLRPGRGRLVIPIASGPSIRRVSLKASKKVQLPAPDGRERTFRLLSLKVVDR